MSRKNTSLIVTAVNFFVYLVVRLLVCFVQAIRIETGARIAAWLAWLLGDVLQIRRRVLDENLSIAFPHLSPSEKRRLIRAMWEHLVLMVLEIAWTPRKIHETNWRHFVRLKNQAELLRMIFDKRPVVLVTGHFGNFEVGGYLLGLLGVPTYTVARPLDNPFVDRFLQRFRSATGQKVISKMGASDELLEAMDKGATVCLLADQAAGPKGCWVDFFGKPASTFKAIALLSLTHQAPLVVAFVRRLGRPMQFELCVHAFVDPARPGTTWDVPTLTQWYTKQLEGIIKKRPEQYWWIHRRWKGTPARKARRKLAA